MNTLYSFSSYKLPKLSFVHIFKDIHHNHGFVLLKVT